MLSNASVGYVDDDAFGPRCQPSASTGYAVFAEWHRYRRRNDMVTINPGETVTFGWGGTLSSSASQRGDGGWQPMSEAPRDGTTIEVRCTYGVAPWYGLYRWIDDAPFGPRWAKVGEDNSSFTDDPSFSWRPYGGSAETYSDPTGGAQNTRAYWLRASGFNPRDFPGSEMTFEEEAKSGMPKRGFFRRLLDGIGRMQ